MSVAFKSAVDDGVVDELRAIIGDDDRVLPNLSSRVNRTRVPAPFPVHRWAEFMPDVAVLPRTAQEVSEVVKLANRLRIPVVPRAGGTGLSDGAVPLRGGILVDVKLMNRIHEVDLVDRTRHGGTGHQHAQAQRGAEAARRLLSRRSRLVSVLTGRRADRHRRMVAAGRALRPYPRQRHLDGDRAAHRRDRGDRRRRRPQAAQVVHRVQPQAALHRAPGHARHLHRGDAGARAAPGGRVRRVLRLRRLHEGVGDRGRPDEGGAGDACRRRALRRVEDPPTCGATTRPTSHSRTRSARSWPSRCTAAARRSNRRPGS